MSVKMNMKVSTRLAAGFGIVLMLMCVVAAIALFRFASFNDSVVNLADNRIPKILQINEWLFQLMETASHTRTMLILEDEELIRKEVDKVRQNQKARNTAVDALKKTVNLPKDKQLLQKILDIRTAYLPSEEAFIQLIQAGDKVAAKELLLQTMRPQQREYIVALHDFLDFQKQMVQEERTGAASEFEYGRVGLFMACLAGLVAGLLAAWLIARSLMQQLGAEPAYVVQIAKQIAQGNLAMPIQLKQGDTSSLAYSITKMRDDLCQIVARVRSGTDTIATAAGQIAAGNQDLSARTEQQASSLEETASSMEELTSTVKQNADNARQASVLSLSAADVAGRGGVVVAEVVQTMGEINESARKIVDIISVIDGIAFQTNILALNAAVEAARAGEQGRGFAVVASEVRNLAQRCTSAAREIKTLIHDSVEKVDAGSRLVDQAGSTMNEVVASVRRVTDIIGEITAASAEQTAGIEQINEAVSQMDNVTQQNAALVEEAAAAAASLQDQAGNLAQVVSVFQLQATQAMAQRTPVAELPAKGGRQRGQTGTQLQFHGLLANY